MVRHGLSSPSQRLSEPEAEQTVRPFESLPGPTRPGTGRANGFFPNVLSKGEGRAHHKRIVK
ncbi:MAG: hypothetical protein Q8P64_06460 [Deltaproteobacteria bacterium]|nr:hypothetical protein [Deltaproteobacteria bacterium]